MNKADAGDNGREQACRIGQGASRTPGQEELAQALDAIERLRRRIEEAGPELPEEPARHYAVALSMIDASLGEAVRRLHEARPG